MNGNMQTTREPVSRRLIVATEPYVLSTSLGEILSCLRRRSNGIYCIAAFRSKEDGIRISFGELFVEILAMTRRRRFARVPAIDLIPQLKA